MWMKKKRRGIESPHGFFGVGVPPGPLIAQRDQKSLLLESQIDLSFHLLCCHVLSFMNPSHNAVRASLIDQPFYWGTNLLPTTDSTEKPEWKREIESIRWCWRKTTATPISCRWTTIERLQIRAIGRRPSVWRTPARPAAKFATFANHNKVLGLSTVMLIDVLASV